MIKNLSEQEQVIFDLVSQIFDELESVLPLFAAQAAEQVFKSFPEISTHFEKQQVKALQQDIRQLAEQESKKIIAQLAHEELWFMSQVRKVRESLHHNPQVWKQIQQLSPALDSLLEKYGYVPQQGPQGAYFPQTQLLHADQLPQSERLKVLTIKYWSSLIRQRQQQVDQIKQAQAVHHRKLDEMWHH